jgi:hypothetical protein
MQKTFELLNQKFMSSSNETLQFKMFFNQFRTDFKKLLKPYIKDMVISKGYFYVSGFFELIDGRIYYFSISDVRWSKDSMLIRTAKSFVDYTGGCNGYVNMNDKFEQNLLKELRLI